MNFVTFVLCCFTETSRYRQGGRRHTMRGSRLENCNAVENPWEGWLPDDVAAHSSIFTKVLTKCVYHF